MNIRSQDSDLATYLCHVKIKERRHWPSKILLECGDRFIQISSQARCFIVDLLTFFLSGEEYLV